MNVTLERQLDEALVAKFWALYDMAFEAMKAASPCRQYLLEDEFREEMADDRILKFVLRDGGDPVSLAFVATDLTAVPWISPPYFQAQYPAEFAAGKVYYFGALLTVPDRRRAGYVDFLLAWLINFVVSNDGVAAFDCCQINDQFLPALIRKAGEEQARVEVSQLDAQTYYGYRALGFKPGYGSGQPFGDNVRPLQRAGEAA